MQRKQRLFRLSASQLITMGFGGLILLGALLLMTPFASANGEGTNFLDALFTATSAICVTGLTTLSTNAHWSLFGQSVILTLIEIGGLGFMTIPVFFFVIMKKKVNLSTRMILREALNSQQMSGEIHLLLYMLKITFGIQAIGMALLACRFVPLYGWGTGLWYSLFHAVSSFCNAGFDLFGDSLVGFQKDPWVLSVISLLIISGGLGFFVWHDVLSLRKTISGRLKVKMLRRLSLHSQIALLVTAGLLLFGTIGFFITEHNNPSSASGTMIQRIFNTIFMSVTPRTAGFFSVDYASMTHAGLVLTMILMFIGGTSGSTAGGFKTTTFGVLLIKMRSTFKGRNRAEFNGRTINDAVIFRALTLFFTFLAVIIISTMILSVTETIPNVNQLGLEYIVFEVISALGTVGLTMGLTPELTAIGKIIILTLMFLGRVGVMTVFFSLVSANKQESNFKYPEEPVIIG